MGLQDQYWTVLGLKPGASLAQVKQAYRTLVKTWHPDRFTHDPKLQQQAEEEIKRLNEAYEYLREYCATDGSSNGDAPAAARPAAPTVTCSTRYATPEERAERLYQAAAEQAKQGNYQAALEDLGVAIRLHPTYAEAYRYRGFIYSVLGMELGAAADLKKADELGLKQTRTARSVPRTQSPPSSPSEPSRILTWKCIHTLSDHSYPLTALALDRGNKVLASADEGGIIHLFNGRSHKRFARLQSPNPAAQVLSMSLDGQLLVSSGQGQLHLWHPTSGSHLRSFSDTSGMVLQALFSSNRQTLLTLNRQGYLRRWETQTGQPISTQVVDDGITAAATNGQWLAGSGIDRTLRIWNGDGVMISTLTAPPRVVALALSPNGKLLAMADANWDVHLWDIARGQRLRTLSGQGSLVETIAFNPNGYTLATGDASGTIKLWTIAQGELLQSLSGHRGAIVDLVYSPDGYTLSSGSADRSLRIWHCHK